jgi:hypothetical protein
MRLMPFVDDHGLERDETENGDENRKAEFRTSKSDEATQ